MGIVLNHSLKNTIITYLGFGIGGVSILFLFPSILGKTFYGLSNYILSCSNVIMPLFAIGMQNTLVKFYSQCKTEKEQDEFLSFTVLCPILLIALLILIGLILGNNNAIIFNSKYYRVVLFLGVGLVLLTVLLNMIFIPLYGIIGSAFATLLSITLYSLSKLLFVVKRMHLYPFTKQTVHSIGITFLVFLLFYFWQFSLNTIIAIGLKSILVTIIYIFINYKLVVSLEINQTIDNFFF